MSLASMKELLQDAERRKYAVGCFNVFNFETLSGVVSVAEELKTPLVLGLSERLFRFADVDALAVAMVRAAHRSSASIAVQLDHGRSYEGIMQAIRWGFSAVMFDGSHLPLAENIRRTREVTRMARAAGVTVEAELDFLTCYVEPLTAGVESHSIEAVQEFVKKTKIDVLAIPWHSQGSVAKRGAAGLDYSMLAQFAQQLKMPLALHVASKLSKDEYRQVIASGISKINIPTEMSVAAVEALKKELAQNPGINLVSLMGVVRKGVKDMVRKYMLYFECIAKGTGNK